MKKRRLLYFTLLFGIIIASCDENVEDIYKGSNDMTQQLNVDWNDAANKSTNALMDNFYPDGSRFFGSEIWWDLSAGAVGAQQMFEQGVMSIWSQTQGINVLIDAYQRSNNKNYLSKATSILESVYSENGGSYLSETSHAETEAIGCVLLRLYKVESDQDKRNEYWIAAKEIFKELEKISEVEDVDVEDEEGATVIYLNGKNGVPTSELEARLRTTSSNATAVIMASQMYHIAKELNEVEADNYLQFAKNVLAFCEKALYEGSGRVYNSATTSVSGLILGQEKTSYSSNQGLMMGASVALYNITKTDDLLKYANLFAAYQVKGSNPERPIWNDTYPVFMPDYKSNVLIGALNRSVLLNRGIYFRYLAELIKVADNVEASTKLYKTCLNNNVESMYTLGQVEGELLWGSRWYEAPYKGEYVSTTDITDPYISKKVIALEAQIAGATLIEMKAALNK